ncbi:MAG: MFS transporter [Candidatus Dormibacteraceae bacterium]
MTQAPPARQAPLLSAGLVWFLVCSFCGMASFYLLMSVLPLDASAQGSSAAGLVTGVSMLGCVATELFLAARLGRLGHVATMALGAALMAIPDALLLTGHTLLLLLAVSLVRGVGLGILVVAGTGIAADLAPPGRRGETLGIYGVAVSLPATVGLPAGVWLAREIGFDTVFLTALGFGLLATVLAFSVPARRHPLSPHSTTFSVLRLAGVRRLTLIFLTTTVATGIYATFLPIAMARTPALLVSLALLAQTVASTSARWVAGRVGDRIGARRLLLPAMATGIVGAVLAIGIGLAPVVVVGMLLFGAGFGALQNLTLALMYERAGEREFGGVGAVWNAAYDTGLGGGALVFGYVTEVTGYPVGFAATAAVLCLGLIPGIRDRLDHRSLNR